VRPVSQVCYYPEEGTDIDTSLTGALGVGFLLGVRHAMDADHIAAVSTFVSAQRSLVRSCLLGTFWGAGHTLALLLAGVVTIALKVTISAAVERALETAVAVVLILLGGHVLLRSFGALHFHTHDHVHHGSTHRHVHVHARGDEFRGHVHMLTIGRRPFLVGLLHGMAGSAALMLLVLAAIPSPLAGLLYIVVFGIGSTAGMLVLSGLLGIPFALSGRRSESARVVVQALAGFASLIVGAVLVWRLSA
jgi:ABC-type nickel/cobalt efflux system permease component RcnA